ncbi:putative high-affinity nickel transporter [Planomonospora sphaerica]|uniref:Putative high-affinity nickel transporter n=1 Tax=Planomonospora sphaerica TaxID=161355 RepID=A0A171DLP3_9ACTN|nr:hypothetical protein [Planomonospora sphaerica]GAT69818.1 putative high-affinity nickel transporter [Planomonospora sphaerica]
MTTGWARLARWVAAAVLTAAGTGVLAAPAEARPAGAAVQQTRLAHPGDEIVQQAYLTPTGSRLAVQLDLTPGALVAPAFARSIDADGDRTITAGEAAAHAALVGSTLGLRVDGRAVPLALAERTYPAYRLLAAAGGTVTIELAAPLPPGARSIVFTDRYAPGRTTVQTNALVADADPAPLEAVTRADHGRTTTLTLARTGVASPVPAAGDRPAAESTDGAAGWTTMLDALRTPLRSPGGLAVLIAACVLLGAFHALTPGHGKALLAAYLVGARSTPKQAVVLGAVITVTHTCAVILLGGAVLTAERFIVPAVLLPALETTAGAIVLLLGARLLVRRHRHRGHDGHHHHHHDVPGRHRHSDHHRPEDGHPHGEHGTHGAHSARSSLATLLRPTVRHQHVPPTTPSAFRGIAAMGAAGGIIPCPEALSVLLAAIGLNRTALGLTMVIAFSVGLAAVLIGLGLILVSGRTALRRFQHPGTGSLIARLPVLSAAVVVVLGVVMTLNGVSALMN